MSKEAYGFDEAAQRKAKSYFYGNLAASLCKASTTLILALLVLDLRLSVRLENFVQTSVSEPLLVVALYSLIGLVAFWLVSLPFNYYKGYVWERKFELSTENLSSWFRDTAMSLVLSLLIVLAFAEGVYNFMWLTPTYWWFLIWLVSSVFIVFSMYAAPIWIMPLFYKFPRLKDEELLNKLTRLAEKAGIRIMGVFEMKAGEKTRKATAGLTGIGNTRRMLLSDTFLSSSSSDEIESVMGHEIGHHVYGHIWKFTALFSAVFLMIIFIANQVMHATVGFFGLGSLDSIASLPLLALTLGLLYVAFIPLANTLSRRWEGRCDQYALDLVGKPDAYISKMAKLCDQNLRYAYPNFIVESLFYDHPSGKKRIERALAYKKIHDSE